MRDYQIGGAHISPQRPQLVSDMGQGSRSVDVTETVNIAATGNVKDAAGSTVIIELNNKKVLDKYGGFIGSFWGLPRNLQYTAEGRSVVETNGSAAFVVYDADNDLEKIFESVTSARYVAKLTDAAGAILYGWIGLVAASSNAYTFDIWSEVGLATQNWFQGGSTAFDAGKGFTVEIYRQSTSLSFSAADTFKEEVPYHEPENVANSGLTEFRLLASLSNGQYAVDYERGRLFGRKLDADDTEVVTYKTVGSAVSTLVDKVSPTTITQSTTTGAGAVAVSATSVVVAYVDFQAPFANTASIFLGDSSLDSANPLTGIELIPGASRRLENVDLNEIYMDVLVDNEDVVGDYFN